MRRSIGKQMMILFLGLIVFMILVLLIANATLLKPYYIRNKRLEFVNMYRELELGVKNARKSEGDMSLSMFRVAEKNNISFLVYDELTGLMLTNVSNREILQNQLFGYMIDRTQQESKMLEEAENYQIALSRDVVTRTEYIEMWGVMKDNSRFILRSPMESIEESASISNRFLIYVGSVVLSVCAVLVWIFSKKISSPLRELAALSRRMAKLDFEAKYNGKGAEEIESLGENFNAMSRKLESAITELKNANHKLRKDIALKEEQEEMRSEFMGNVSHELKTPIALIRGYAEGLRDGIVEDVLSRREYCDVIIDESAKMNHMVKNMMMLNQLEFGDNGVEFERFDLRELILGIIQSMDIMTRQKEATVLFSRKDPLFVWADAFRIEQVLRNYMGNAYNHLGGEKVIDLRLKEETDQGYVRVSVFNTGEKIPEEDLLHIWDKFYKVDKAHTRKYGGNGIGLSIVKAIMESHNQEYGVRNYDNGVEFWFTLDVK